MAVGRGVEEVAWTFRNIPKLDIGIYVLFDRDYRCNEEIERFSTNLNVRDILCDVLDRKEIENYALAPKALVRTIHKRLAERQGSPDVSDDALLKEIVEICNWEFKEDVRAQLISNKERFCKEMKDSRDPSSIIKEVNIEFERAWSSLEGILGLLPGKEFIGRISGHFQREYKVTLTPTMLIDGLNREEISPKLKDIVKRLNDFVYSASSKT